MVNAINVKSTAKEAPVSLPISKSDKQVSFFINDNKSATLENNIAGTSWTAFYVDEDEYDEMFVFVFGKNNVRVDEIEYDAMGGLELTLPFSSIFNVGTWSQTGSNVNVNFHETVYDKYFNITNEILWDFKLKIIDEKTMEGTILHNGELIGKAELYKTMK
jgi:hypothetical protein